MKGYVFILRPGDNEAIKNEFERLETKTDEELIESYNKQYEIGFVGVHQQAIHVLGLHNQFLKRFDDSPVRLQHNSFITFKGKVKSIIDNKIYYENE